jgi:hypothetical protein
VQNNQNLQILFALLFPIRFSLKKYPSEMKFAPKKHHFFYYLGRKIIHQRAVCFRCQIFAPSKYIFFFCFLIIRNGLIGKPSTNLQFCKLPKPVGLFSLVRAKSKTIEFTNCGKSRLTTEANPTPNKDSNHTIKARLKLSVSETRCKTK